MTPKEIYLAQNLKYLPKSKHQAFIKKIDSLSENELKILYGVELKNPTNWLLAYIFIPFFWLTDRFFTGNQKSGVIKAGIVPITFVLIALTKNIIGNQDVINLILILACVIDLIWMIVDCFTIQERVRFKNWNNLGKAIT